MLWNNYSDVRDFLHELNVARHEHYGGWARNKDVIWEDRWDRECKKNRDKYRSEKEYDKSDDDSITNYLIKWFFKVLMK